MTYPVLTPRAGGFRARAKHLLFTLVLAGLASGWTPNAARAANRTWTGNASGFWSNPNNWSPNGVPQAGDDLIFPSSGSPFSGLSGNDLNNLAVRSLFFTRDHTLTGNALGISAGIQAGSGTETVSVSVQCPITLMSDVDVVCAWGQGIVFNVNDLHLEGAIQLNGHHLNLYADSIDVIGSDHGNIYVSGAIAGAGEVSAMVEPRAFIEFSGSQENTFSGPMSIFTRGGTHVSFNKPEIGRAHV